MNINDILEDVRHKIMFNALTKDQQMIYNVNNGVCKRNKHFPEYIYKWDMPEINKSMHWGHCAICGTDYSIKEFK